MEIDITQCELHKNRIVFAVVNDELKISNTNLNHKDWLLNLGVDAIEFENTPRGYILKIGDNHYKTVSYIGSNFDTIELKYNILLQLTLIIEILNNGHATIDWFSGVHKGNIGEEWEPKHYVTTTKSPKVKFKHLSKIRLLNYEELIANLINNNTDEYDIVTVLEKELDLVQRLLTGECKYNSTIADRAYRFYDKLK